jgi:signal peptidase I
VTPFRAKPNLGRLAGILALALLLVLLGWVRSDYRLAVVIGDSMLPHLRTGDLLLVDKRAYLQADPRRDDVVVAQYGPELIVKRIVALPGEKVALRNGKLYLDGLAVRERHPIQAGPLNISEGRLLPGRFALLGDNREAGLYQSVHAVLGKSEIIGRVICSVPLHHLL